MSDKINNGGPAFPLSRESSLSKNYEGMTLRDWFAGHVLAGLCAHQDTWGLPDVPTVCRQAYHIADAMIAARGGAA